MSIRLKLSITYLAVALAPLLFLGGVSFHNYRDSLEKVRTSQLQDITAYKAHEIGDLFSRLRADIQIAQSFYNIKTNLPVLSALAGTPSAPAFQAAREMLDAQLRPMAQVKGLYDIHLTDAGGRVVYASNPAHWKKHFLRALPDPAKLAFAQGRKGVYFSEIFFNELEAARPTMLVSAPVTDFQGKFRGVLAFAVDMTPVYDLVQDSTGLGETGETLVGKKDGQDVLFLNPVKYDSGAALKRRVKLGDKLGGPIQEAVQGRPGSGLMTDYRGETVVAAWRSIPVIGWGIVAKIDAAEAFADARHVGHLVLAVMAGLVLLCGLTAFYMARSLSDPIKQLTEGIAVIGSGDLDHKVGTGQKDEIGQLSRAFDAVISDLKKTTASRDALNEEVREREQAEATLRRSEGRRALLADSAAALLEAGDPQALIDRICRRTMEFLDCQVFFNYLYVEEKRRLRLNAYAGIPAEEGARIAWLDYGVAVCGCVARDGERIVAENIFTTKDPRTDLVRGYGVRAYCCHPLKAGAKTLGTISFGTTKRDTFAGDDVALMKATADMVAIAIQRKRAEEALRQSEARLRGFYDGKLIGLIYWTLDGRITDANDKFLEMTGYTREDLAAGRIDWAKMTPPEFAYLDELSVKELKSAGANAKPFEKEFFRKDGTRLPVEVAGSMLDRENSGGVAFVLDITRRKLAQAMLENERDNLQKIFDGVGVGMLLLDEKGAITRVNNSITRWFDKRPEALLGAQPGNATGCVHVAGGAEVCGRTPACRECTVRKAFESVLATGRPVRGVEALAEIVSGTGKARLWLDVSANPLVIDGRKYVLLSLNDITERKNAEEGREQALRELRESENRVRLKIESIIAPEGDVGGLELGDIIDAGSFQLLMDKFYAVAAIPMALIDVKGKVLVGVGWQEICTRFHRVNPETCAHCIESDTKLTAGVSPGEFRLYKCRNGLWDVATPIMLGGKHKGNLFIGQFFLKDSPPDREFFRAQARRYGFDEKAYMAALDRIPVLDRGSLDTTMGFFLQLAQMLSQTSFNNLTLARTLTERERLTLSLKEREEELKRSNENLEQFAYVASHDLQEPLRMMASYSELLERRYKPKLDSDAGEFIAYIVDGAKRLQKLINDLLAYSRVGRLDQAAEDGLDCGAILDRVLSGLRPALEESGAVVTHGPLPTLTGNESSFIQLFQNLVGNAIKFRGKEAPRVHVGAEKKGRDWLFSVRDNGIGIEPQYKDRVFLIFQRLHGRGEYPGTGIGLSICKKIVETRGGKIWLESEPGKGTVFYFTVPEIRRT